MKLKKIKNFSIVLVILATILLVLNIIDIRMVFGKRETGLWDTMPSFVRQTMFLAYPVLLLTSYTLAVWTRKVKIQFESIASILFLINGLAIVLLIVVYLIELTKNS